MPTIFSFFGMRFQFYLNEHEPIHIHVIKDDTHSKWVVEPEVSLVENNGMKKQELKHAEAIIEENKELIITRWKEIFNRE